MVVLASTLDGRLVSLWVEAVDRATDPLERVDDIVDGDLMSRVSRCKTIGGRCSARRLTVLALRCSYQSEISVIE